MTTLYRCWDGTNKKHKYVNIAGDCEYDECWNSTQKKHGVYCNSTFYPRCYNATSGNWQVEVDCCGDVFVGNYYCVTLSTPDFREYFTLRYGYGASASPYYGNYLRYYIKSWGGSLPRPMENPCDYPYLISGCLLKKPCGWIWEDRTGMSCAAYEDSSICGIRANPEDPFTGSTFTWLLGGEISFLNEHGSHFVFNFVPIDIDDFYEGCHCFE